MQRKRWPRRKAVLSGSCCGLQKMAILMQTWVSPFVSQDIPAAVSHLRLTACPFGSLQHPGITQMCTYGKHLHGHSSSSIAFFGLCDLVIAIHGSLSSACSLSQLFSVLIVFQCTFLLYFPFQVLTFFQVLSEPLLLLPLFFWPLSVCSTFSIMSALNGAVVSKARGDSTAPLMLRAKGLNAFSRTMARKPDKAAGAGQPE